jgi:hypothetical protein
MMSRNRERNGREGNREEWRRKKKREKDDEEEITLKKGHG